MTYYLDSHAHIISEEFEQDLDELLERAEQADVKRIMIMCTSEAEIDKAFSLVDSDPFRFACAYGIHPEDANDWQGKSPVSARSAWTITGSKTTNRYSANCSSGRSKKPGLCINRSLSIQGMQYRIHTTL